ncbi:hypothetical protein ZIOFF_061062 [Zingiber officinale]|uniref:Pentatricopeptide repeat-containing protein n=1 Tax=Zingiber officinale TaxID=94328 RepID=A0A8J5FBJ8_ZINOF|nr:hypothetical protein ZIOFF_061062 [Zingiber officinale]
MAERDAPAWNAVISGCTRNGLFLEALSFFSRMVVDRTLPKKTTASCLFSACAHLGMLRLGKSVHGYVFKNSMGGSPLFAMHSLICMTNGHSSLAIETFREMEQEGPQPDQVTLMGLLNACTHAGLVDEGLSYFNSMTRDYTIDPEIEHYGCVIDLLSRASRVHGTKDLAELALRNLLELKPKSVDYGFMLTNLYSECSKCGDVGKVRKRLNQLGGKKLPGCSWIEVEKRVRQFYSGDTIHPEVGQIYEILDELVELTEA